jgi:prepilin-type N-terminal cleavage/methylation domain-containing protein
MMWRRIAAVERRARSRVARRRGEGTGLTLLETMVALAILGLVVLGYLEVFTASSRATRQADVWSQAVAYAEDGMEAVKIEPENIPVGRQHLVDGFERAVEIRPWDAGLQLVTVIVYLPEGGSFTASRLFEAGP